MEQSKNQQFRICGSPRRRFRDRRCGLQAPAFGEQSRRLHRRRNLCCLQAAQRAVEVPARRIASKSALRDQISCACLVTLALYAKTAVQAARRPGRRTIRRRQIAISDPYRIMATLRPPTSFRTNSLRENPQSKSTATAAHPKLQEANPANIAFIRSAPTARPYRYCKAAIAAPIACRPGHRCCLRRTQIPPD